MPSQSSPSRLLPAFKFPVLFTLALANSVSSLLVGSAASSRSDSRKVEASADGQSWWKTIPRAPIRATLHGTPAGVAEEAAEQIWPIFGSKGKHNDYKVRAEYMNNKTDIDKAAFKELRQRPTVIDKHKKAPVKKVAFLFMLMDDISWHKVWTKFFEGARPEQYSIYVHRAGIPDDEDTEHKVPFTRLGAISVPWVNSSWCALMGVEVAILKTALKNPANEQFVFISQDTVPLKRFTYVYNNLIGSSETSKFCFGEPARHKNAWVEQVSNELSQRCIFRDFYRAVDPHVMKHHEWIVLSRQHAGIIAERARDGLDVWSKAWAKAAPDLPNQGEGCSDESVPITTLLMDAREKNQTSDDVWADLEQMGIEQNCLTFVNWYNCFMRTEFHLPGWGLAKSIQNRGSDLYKYMTDDSFDFVHETKLNGFPTVYSHLGLKYLKSLTQHGFMFARKFPREGVQVTHQGNTSNKSFVKVLPRLWEEVDEDKAKTLIWTRLETNFNPRPTVYRKFLQSLADTSFIR